MSLHASAHPLDSTATVTRHPVDATTGLTVFIALQLAIPSALQLTALGGVGYLASLWALVLGAWWCWARIERGPLTPADRNPVRLASFALLCSVLVSYVLAMGRPMSPIESSQADLGVLRILVGVSLVLVASDGITSWSRLVTLLRRLTTAGGAFAALGLLQFFTAQSWTDWIALPGFTRSEDYASLQGRSGFVRASATALHPLEFAAALSMILPVAVSLALADTTRTPVRRWAAPVLMVLSLVLSGSRSAYLGLALGALVMSTRWSAAIRLRLGAAGALMAVLVFLTVPGMLGTIRNMFLFLGDDPSAQSRTASYRLVGQFVAAEPGFGRGLGTFLPMYRILDNQILLLLVELGVVGLTIFLVLAGTSAIGAWRRSCAVADPLHRELGPALSASLVAGVSLLFFFDAFAFPISFGLLFLMLGVGGAYYLLAAPTAPPAREDADAGR